MKNIVLVFEILRKLLSHQIITFGVENLIIHSVSF